MCSPRFVPKLEKSADPSVQNIPKSSNPKVVPIIKNPVDPAIQNIAKLSNLNTLHVYP